MANLTNSSNIIDEINSKLTNPDGGSNGQVLTITGGIEAWGPAPEGYHVPSKDEWDAVRYAGRDLGAWYNTGGDDFRIKMKMPFAGKRSWSTSTVLYQGSDSNYWSSTAISADNVYCLYFDSSSLSGYGDSRAYGYSVRAFRNSPLTPDSSWTTIYEGSNGAGIFHNPTEGVISISSDGQTWITIADKNLGATTVYNDGDELSEANCGKYYQRGNNYGFPRTGTISKKSSTQIDASAYGKGNPYSSDTFITGSIDWSSVRNDNLWGMEEVEPTPQWKDLELPETIGDVRYSDFNFVQLSGSSVELSISSAIEPTSNFTINAPAELKEGIVYTLRVKNGNTAYTMTLGEGITNPGDTDITLTPNAIDQFVFLAVDGVLELQPEAQGGGGGSVTPQEFNDLKEKVDELELAKDPNVTVVGTPTILQGNISDFDTNSYLIAPFLSSFSNNPFILHMDVATGEDVTTQQNIVDSVYGLAVAIKEGKFLIALSTNGTSWNIGQFDGTNTVLANTDYHVEVEWTGSDFTLKYSTDGTNYTTDITAPLTTALSGKPLYFGGFGATSHPFKGTFNFNEWYFLSNGNKVWMGMDSVGLETRANVSLSNLDEEGEARFNSKQDVISDLGTIRTQASQGATAYSMLNGVESLLASI